MVRLVALTMKTSSKIQVPVARGFKFVNVEPLGLSPEIPISFAERVTRAKTVQPFVQQSFGISLLRKSQRTRSLKAFLPETERLSKLPGMLQRKGWKSTGERFIIVLVKRKTLLVRF